MIETMIPVSEKPLVQTPIANRESNEQLLIRTTRTNSHPQVGDIVQYLDDEFNYFPNAHIQSVSDKELLISLTDEFLTVKELRGILCFWDRLKLNRKWVFISRDLVWLGTEERLFRSKCGSLDTNFKELVNVWGFNPNV